LKTPVSSSTHRRIYAVVSRIPRGRVATYGQIARLANVPGQARLVGYALSALPHGSRVPWHRVVNARGRISPRRDGGPEARIQRHLLETEKVRFDADGRIPLAAFRWRPRSADKLRPEYRFDYSHARVNRFAARVRTPISRIRIRPDNEH
jgi:methylated-DNA-protein-cysteine methyltransferase-like protein